MFSSFFSVQIFILIVCNRLTSTAKHDGMKRGFWTHDGAGSSFFFVFAYTLWLQFFLYDVNCSCESQSGQKECFWEAFVRFAKFLRPIFGGKFPQCLDFYFFVTVFFWTDELLKQRGKKIKPRPKSGAETEKKQLFIFKFWTGAVEKISFRIL
jgi:hypothetical protein